MQCVHCGKYQYTDTESTRHCHDEFKSNKRQIPKMEWVSEPWSEYLHHKMEGNTSDERFLPPNVYFKKILGATTVYPNVLQTTN